MFAIVYFFLFSFENGRNKLINYVCQSMSPSISPLPTESTPPPPTDRVSPARSDWSWGIFPPSLCKDPLEVGTLSWARSCLWVRGISCPVTLSLHFDSHCFQTDSLTFVKTGQQQIKDPERREKDLNNLLPPWVQRSLLSVAVCIAVGWIWISTLTLGDLGDKALSGNKQPTEAFLNKGELRKSLVVLNKICF